MVFCIFGVLASFIQGEVGKGFLEKMEIYLLSKQEEYPSIVDIACTLASVKLELKGRVGKNGA